MGLRFLACLTLLTPNLSCGPLRTGGSEEGLISVGDEFYGACNHLLEAGAFDITNIVLFYAGKTPYSVARTKDGTVVMSSHLLVYTRDPSQEIRKWFLLPDNTCVSVQVRQGNAGRISTVELGERGKGLQPPAQAVRPDGFSPKVEDPSGSSEVEIHDLEKPAGTGFWSSQVRKTVERLWIEESAAKTTTLAVGMPLRLAAEILARHAAEDITSGVSIVSTVTYVRGKHPRTIPWHHLYILPGNTLVILAGSFDPLSSEQFTVEEIQVGETGFGYPGKMKYDQQKFKPTESFDLKDPVHDAGPLHFAARIGDLNALQALLREGEFSVNSLDRERYTALHWAAKRGKLEAARILIRAGADLNAVNPQGNTPLILAAEEGHSTLVALLLELGARTSVLNKRKRSAFLAAGGRGDVATVSLLLERYQADPNQADESGFTLLHRAAGHSDADLARVLLKHGADPNVLRSESISPLYEAAGDGAVEVARLLLEAGARVTPATEKEWRVLDAVAGNGSVEIARMLIARGAKPDGPALYTAANSGHAGLVKLFLDHGADLQYRESTWKRTALHTAHSAGVVKVLVEAGLDIEVKNEIGETPLHEAAHFAPHEVVVALLELGADPHVVSQWKKTPLQNVESRDPDRGQKEEIVQTLRAAMAQVKPKKPPQDRK